MTKKPVDFRLFTAGQPYSGTIAGMDEDQLYLHPRNPPAANRQTFAGLSPNEFIAERLAQMPTRQDLWRATLLGMLGGATLTISMALAFWH